ncbi:MAG: Rrf2 family transcriptional regulator [Bacteroidetes bacterium]|jgi:Rrf2 family protein|nr:Rrf2 family transcriptional regulator [Bacteroidota bacterium]
MFSRSCEYAIRIVVFLTNQSDSNNYKSVTVVAKKVSTPYSYTSKILLKLSAAGIVESTKGKFGGYYIEEKNKNLITLSDVIKVIDGESVFKTCVLGFPKCSDVKPCALHHNFKFLRDELNNKISSIKILDLKM